NTLEALCGAYLLRRIRFRRSLQRMRDVLGLIFLAAALSTAVSASIGVTVGWLSGMVSPVQLAGVWRTWWQGDALGVLVLTPLLLLVSTRSRLRLSRQQAVEGFVLLISLALLSLIVFGGSPAVAPPYYAEPYLLFPCLIWAALRFSQPGVAVASV